MPSTDNFRIRFDNVSKHYGTHKVIEHLDLNIRQGEFVSLLGPSGSGKTTLLMILAGFENVSGGSVWVDERRVDQVPAHKRDMGIVFQNYALFPHMTAAENIAFPLRRRGIPKASITGSVKRVLDMVQLSDLSDRKPVQMSGGQQQRIALARALVFAPKVVLMDEPLGALDKQLREQMQLDIRELHHRLGLTIVFVTHDQGEALTMSDRIAVFNRGRIEQVASPEDVYDRPASQFVAEFIGETNLLTGTVRNLENGFAVVGLQSGTEVKVKALTSFRIGETVQICVRPERIALSLSSNPNSNAMEAVVRDVVYQGDHVRVRLESCDLSLIVRAERRAQGVSIGDKVFATFPPTDCWVFQP